jgi:predicted dehydrogenase
MHVLCEKPFARNVREAREMAGLASAAGVVLGVNHEFRHFPARTHLLRLLREGAIGEPVHFVIRDYFPMWARNPARKYNWLADVRRGGGILGALGSHHVDAMRTRGGEIRAVSARVFTIARTLPDATGVPRAVTADDSFTLRLRFESGATGLVDANGGTAVRMDSHEAHGSEASLLVRDHYTLVRRDRDGKEETLATPADLAMARTNENVLLAPFRVQLERLRAAIRGESAFSPDGEEGVRIQEVLDAARRSSATGREIEISPL